MKITEVTVSVSLANAHLKAFANIVINGWFAVHGIKLLHDRHRFFLEFPSRSRPGKSPIPVAFPINNETRQKILKAVLAEYEKVAGGNSCLKLI